MIKQELERIYPGVRFWNPEMSNISTRANIGKKSVIHAGVHIHDHVVIGERCQIEAQVFIPNGVTIEDEVFIGPQVCFTNDPFPGSHREGWKPTKTWVKKGAKIGAGVRILAGVTIGEHAIVGMGAVVLHDIPSGETWVGVPAKRIK